MDWNSSWELLITADKMEIKDLPKLASATSFIPDCYA